MIQLHYYLDARAVKDGKNAPLKLIICKRGQSAQLSTGITLLPSEWDSRTQRVINNPRKRTLNADLARIRADVEDFLRPKIWSGELADMTATEIKYLIDEYVNGVKCSATIRELVEDYVKDAKAGTRQIYNTALKKLAEYDDTLPDSQARSLSAIKVEDFVKWHEKRNAPNTVTTNLRCLKAVYNRAVKAGKMRSNPFAGVDTSVHESRSRDLTIEQLRVFLFSPCEREKEKVAVDFFTLSFLLRAINPVDLQLLTPADYVDGRIYYTREKTGKGYSVKVEPEAEAIISTYRDKKHLFSTDIDLYQQLTQRADRLGLPKVSMYWARHTLASLLFEQGVSVDLVGEILGHSNGRRVTMRYLDIKEKQKDNAMRELIDWVWEKKKGETALDTTENTDAN